MITIAGAGVAGLSCAFELAKRGRRVAIYEAGASPADNTASWFAGGMLAPWCEGEVADPIVTRLAVGAIDWWQQVTPVSRNGTLVLTSPRDRAELDQFARRTEGHRWVDAGEIGVFEPVLDGRFHRALFFEGEAHLDPRRALFDLAAAVQELGARIHYGTLAPERIDVDCRGVGSDLPGLRAVRGEMALIELRGVDIKRTLRLLHPRIPLYLVPRGDDQYMIGATMIDTASRKPITVRSLLELLGAAFTLHPALGEATVIETGVGLRPAFADNIPRLIRQGDTFHVNGLYRHGFLVAPALAGQLARKLCQDTHDQYSRECRTA